VRFPSTAFIRLPKPNIDGTNSVIGGIDFA
jgi:hypothetical protein